MGPIDELKRFRHYFIDLPLWSCGIRSRSLEKRLYRNFEPEIPVFRNGYQTLATYMNKSVTAPEIDEMVQKAFWVKVVRESDAYTSLRMSMKNLFRYFQVDGLDHLKAVKKENRPIIILTGHIGSFFIPSLAFHHLGYQVYPVARSVDKSPATPHLIRLYQTLNYRFMESRFSARYILTDFSGKIDRAIVSVSKDNGIFWVAIDFPWRVYQHRHLPVRLFGQPATLPSGIIRWGIKKKAIFLTGWNSIEANSTGFYRLLSVDSPIACEYDTTAILQEYADRLSAYVMKKPWQWMALPSIHQYGEACPRYPEQKLPDRGETGNDGHSRKPPDKVLK